jgi:2-polyprenyl-6-methoxyphenol hydroxylase-like FAD-dependent oxidoreductase
MKKVLIAGVGIAGLTSAIYLERAGFEVDLVEIAKEWAPVGAGIVLWPNCLKILGTLGLRAQTEAMGTAIEEMTVADENGKKISSLQFDKLFEKGLYAVSISRADLHSILAGGLKNTNVMLNDSVDSLDDDGTKVTVKLSSGRTSVYDLVIGADGIHSRVRTLLFGDVKPRYAGYTAWRFLVNGEIEFDRKQAYEYWGKGGRFGIVPTGRGDSNYGFLVLNSPHGSFENKNISIEKFKHILSQFNGAAGEFIKLINEDTVLIHNDIEDIRLDKWYKGNVVLIGDAAHAITPNLGAGALMAMEDSAIVADNLTRFDKPEDAFRAFFEARFKRVKKICNDSYRLGKAGNLESGVLRSVRNFISRNIPERFYINIVKTVSGE